MWPIGLRAKGSTLEEFVVRAIQIGNCDTNRVHEGQERCKVVGRGVNGPIEEYHRIAKGRRAKMIRQSRKERQPTLGILVTLAPDLAVNPMPVLPVRTRRLDVAEKV